MRKDILYKKIQNNASMLLYTHGVSEIDRVQKIVAACTTNITLHPELKQTLDNDGKIKFFVEKTILEMV